MTDALMKDQYELFVLDDADHIEALFIARRKMKKAINGWIETLDALQEDYPNAFGRLLPIVQSLNQQHIDRLVAQELHS